MHNAYFFVSLQRKSTKSTNIMKEIIKSVHITLKEEGELNEVEQELVAAAKEATFRSYAPYSRFCVGAAALLDNGEIVTGNNQENCAYPSGLCAERTTLFYANSRYPDVPVRTLCIAARDSSGSFTKEPISPCGACRQVMLETEHRYSGKMEVLLYGEEETYVFESAADLLPLIQRWIASGETYTVRFGIGMLMAHFLDGDFRPETLDAVAAIKTEEYYLRMMQAWYFATALAKQYEAALPVLEAGRLEPWTHNKAIQKACESRRISAERKTYLKTLKKKKE